jgi:two-component system response regulator (stage 0 sporulation protein F)
MSSANAHILIVDDELDLRELLAQMLESEGFRVSQASGGRMALEILKKESVDLVISDVRMPDGDGVELLKNIKATNPKLPLVIMITGFSDSSEAQILKLGAHAMFMKPFDTDAFSQAIHAAIDLAKAARD